MPVVVASLSEEPITLAACGWRHTTVVSVLGKVYSWGRGCCGQLGHGDLDDLCAAIAVILATVPHPQMHPHRTPSQVLAPPVLNRPCPSTSTFATIPPALSGASQKDLDAIALGERGSVCK